MPSFQLVVKFLILTFGYLEEQISIYEFGQKYFSCCHSRKYYSTCSFKCVFV